MALRASKPTQVAQAASRSPASAGRARRSGARKRANSFGSSTVGVSPQWAAMPLPAPVGGPPRWRRSTGSLPRPATATGVVKYVHDVGGSAKTSAVEEESKEAPELKGAQESLPFVATAASFSAGTTSSSAAVDTSLGCMRGGLFSSPTGPSARPSLMTGTVTANFGQVSMEVAKTRGRYVATRDQLERVRRSRLEPAVESSFYREVEDVKAEVSALVDELKLECVCLSELELETKELWNEVGLLSDNDKRMAALLEKMNWKLDVLQSAVGYA